MDTAQLKQMFDDHEKQDDLRFDDVREIRDTLKIVQENHLHHIETDMARMAGDVEWLKKFFWLVATGVIGGLILQIWK